ncbi:ABC transporter permease [Nakamurella deserti]|uniref:ABC transporter permease n=1 Tax=Nakamurella deserti TaxID=2164074 RepID=UPI000DBE31A4|nr:ABC transporter permease subunit [Nakamurella deserti]
MTAVLDPAARATPTATEDAQPSIARVVARRTLLSATVLISALVGLGVIWVALFKVFDVNPLVGKTPGNVWDYLFTSAPTTRGIRPQSLSAEAARSELWGALGTTLVDAAIGFFTGLAIALVVAALFVLLPAVEFAFMPIAMLLRSVPLVAMAPVLLMMFTGKAAIAAIGAIVVLFPALVNIVIGLRSASPQSLDVVKVYGGSDRDALFRVRIPSALPHFFAAVRISVPGAVVGAMLAEWLSGSEGFGGLLNKYQGANKTGVWAIVVFSVVISIVLYEIATIIESAVLAQWGPNAGKR